MPEQSVEALLIEHVAMALNPRMTLYRDKSLRWVLEQDASTLAREQGIGR
jgi:hypothetical protein